MLTVVVLSCLSVTGSSGTAVVEVMGAVCYAQKQHLSFSKYTITSKILFVPDVDFSFICLSLIHSKYKNCLGSS
jgi:hypothetical protein